MRFSAALGGAPVEQPAAAAPEVWPHGGVGPAAAFRGGHRSAFQASEAYEVPVSSKEPAPPPPEPPLQRKRLKPKNEQPMYGSPFLCYPMVALKTPDSPPVGEGVVPLAAALLPLPGLRRHGPRSRRGGEFF